MKKLVAAGVLILAAILVAVVLWRRRPSSELPTTASKPAEPAVRSDIPVARKEMVGIDELKQRSLLEGEVVMLTHLYSGTLLDGVRTTLALTPTEAASLQAVLDTARGRSHALMALHGKTEDLTNDRAVVTIEPFEGGQAIVDDAARDILRIIGAKRFGVMTEFHSADELLRQALDGAGTAAVRFVLFRQRDQDGVVRFVVLTEWLRGATSIYPDHAALAKEFGWLLPLTPELVSLEVRPPERSIGSANPDAKNDAGSWRSEGKVMPAGL